MNDPIREFVRGDVVRLKSGGPAMTIAFIMTMDNGKKLIKCNWFDNHGVLQMFDFIPDSLEHAET